MSAYRFCRTDDIGLLVDALNRCWSPHFPDEPQATPASFKRSIRNLQVWCSSCMVAFAGGDPIGVLIGAKRPSGTLIHRLAVHPDHLRQGHGRHLLDSLRSKLAILGPPRVVAEVPGAFEAARALFRAGGFAEEGVLTDYVWERGENESEPDPTIPPGETFVIPITVDDLAVNDLLATAGPSAWERSVETLIARKDEIEGLAVASDDRIESCILYVRDRGELLALRSFVQDNGARLKHLLSRLPAPVDVLRFPKVHPAEVSGDLLANLGFRAAGGHLLYAATARPA